MTEIREVLRAWLSGSGLRKVAEQAGVDRKTARRYVQAAAEAGLARDGGPGQLTDELVAALHVCATPINRAGQYTTLADATCPPGLEPCEKTVPLPVTPRVGEEDGHGPVHPNDRLVDALMAQALSALGSSPGARAFYDAQRAAGVEHNAALRKLANRLVGILHGCLKTRNTYDESTA